MAISGRKMNQAGDPLIRNRRFFLRPIEDVEAGGMSSCHSTITIKGNALRGEIHLRDCDNQISFEFWGGDGARPGSVERVRGVVDKLCTELCEFLDDYETAAEQIEEQ